MYPTLRRFSTTLRLAAIGTVALSVAACGGSPTGVAEDPAFAGTPAIAGVITVLTPPTASSGMQLFVQVQPGVGGCDPTMSARVDVGPSSGARSTVVRRQSGAGASAAELEVGRRVQVWGGRNGLLMCPGGDISATGILLLDSPAP